MYPAPKYIKNAIPFSLTDDFMELLDTKCQLRQIGQYLNSYYMSFALPKGHPIYEPLAKTLRLLNENGKIAQIMQSHPELSGVCRRRSNGPSSSTLPQQLTVFELRGLFMVAGGVLAAAFGLTLCIRIISELKKKFAGSLKKSSSAISDLH